MSTEAVSKCRDGLIGVPGPQKHFGLSPVVFYRARRLANQVTSRYGGDRCCSFRYCSVPSMTLFTRSLRFAFTVNLGTSSNSSGAGTK